MTQKNMPFDAPVVGEVARRVLDHADTNFPEALRPPVSVPALTLVFRPWDLRPVGDPEWNA